ncbi:MAG: CsgG/HfaB family protein [Longimicrobiales bacterium]
MIRQMTLIMVLAVVLFPGPAFSQSSTRLAVLDFNGEGPTERFATYSRTISENLVLGFTRSRGIRVMERARITEALSELKLSASGAVTTESAIQLGRMLGATGVVLGSYGVVNDEIVITTRYVDVATAEVSNARRVIGRDLLPMVDILAEQLILDITPFADERQEILQRRCDREALARSMMKSPGVAAGGSLLLPILGHGYLGRSSNVVRGIIYTVVGTGAMVLGVMWSLGDDGLMPFIVGAGVHVVSAIDAGISAGRINQSLGERVRLGVRLNPSARSPEVAVSIRWPR